MIGIKGIAKKPIVDATATSEDVKSGKVYYNNNGRSVGSLSSDLVYKTQSFTITAGSHPYEQSTEAADITYGGCSFDYILNNNMKCITSCGRFDLISRITDIEYSVNINLANVAYFSIDGTHMCIGNSLSTPSYTSESVTDGSK